MCLPLLELLEPAAKAEDEKVIRAIKVFRNVFFIMTSVSMLSCFLFR